MEAWRGLPAMKSSRKPCRPPSAELRGVTSRLGRRGVCMSLVPGAMVPSLTRSPLWATSSMKGKCPASAVVMGETAT